MILSIKANYQVITYNKYIQPINRIIKYYNQGGLSYNLLNCGLYIDNNDNIIYMVYTLAVFKAVIISFCYYYLLPYT